MNTAGVTRPDPPPVVTLFELYGAGAADVGVRVAEALGMPFHAQAFSSEELEDPSALEQNAVLATVLAVLGGAYRGLEGRDIVATQQQKHDLVAENNRVVRQLARSGGVIVGRNGAVVLADRPNTLHVLLTGARQDRIERAARQADISADRAARRLEREDDVRAEMSKALYGWDPRQPDRYDLVLDTSRIPPAGAAEAIVHALRAVLR